MQRKLFISLNGFQGNLNNCVLETDAMKENKEKKKRKKRKKKKKGSDWFEKTRWQKDVGEC